MIKGKAFVTKPESVELTISLTATVENWHHMIETLATAPQHPNWEFVGCIRQAIHNLVENTETVQEVST